MTTPPRRLLHPRVATMAIGCVLFAACGIGDRPSVAEWTPSWDRIVATIPAPAELGDPPDKELCAETLGIIREAAPDLRMTPDLAADSAVANWLETAESAFFECPPESGEITSFAIAFDELARLEAEVDVALGIDDR